MAGLTLNNLGVAVSEKRGSRGIRDTASEVGISHSTLSRIERGFLPDLETFSKICKWLKIDPSEVLGLEKIASNIEVASVHFRKDQAIAPATAEALAQAILCAQRALVVMNSDNI